MQAHTTPTKNAELKTFGRRMGKIFSNLLIFTLILCLCALLSFLSVVFVWLFGIVLIILTVGTIFAMVPDYFSRLSSASNVTSNIAEFFFDNFYIFVSLCLVCAIASIVLLALDKQNKHTGRIVLSSLAIVICIILIIIYATGGLQWKA